LLEQLFGTTRNFAAAECRVGTRALVCQILNNGIMEKLTVDPSTKVRGIDLDLVHFLTLPVINLQAQHVPTPNAGQTGEIASLGQ
jgi:hypothetical protein